MKGDRFANVMAESIVRQIAVKMYRSQDAEEPGPPILQEAAASKHELVSDAVQSMEHHLYDIKELSQLAEKLPIYLMSSVRRWGNRFSPIGYISVLSTQ